MSGIQSIINKSYSSHFPGGHWMCRYMCKVSPSSLEMSIKASLGTTIPTLRKQVSGVFGYGLQKMQHKKTTRIVSGETELSLVTDAHRTNGRHRDRGVISHIRATARGLADFTKDSDVVLIGEVSDDCSLWTRLPGEQPDKCKVPRGTKRKTNQ